jgi:hypothetical protein
VHPVELVRFLAENDEPLRAWLVAAGATAKLSLVHYAAPL